jgi:hypothetical protein
MSSCTGYTSKWQNLPEDKLHAKERGSMEIPVLWLCQVPRGVGVTSLAQFRTEMSHL